MTAIAELQTAYETGIATISDDLRQKKATYVLERYIAAVQKQTALEASEIESYSIAGRTVTRRNVESGQSAISDLEAELDRYIYGGTALINMNAGTREL